MSTEPQLELLSCPSKGTTARASTTLNGNSKLYGPLNALDTKDESSCWNSDQAPAHTSLEEQQIFIINFQRLVKIRQLKIMFQGGFVPQQLQVFIQTASGDPFERLLIDDEEIYEPQDSSAMQDIPIEVDPASECSIVKLVMGDGNDFYGRMTIYRLEVWGYETGGD